MLSFAVSGPSQPVVHQPQGSVPGAGTGARSVRRAYLIGKEDLPVPGAVGVDAASGGIVCRKSFNGAAALGLQVDCAAAGLLTLRTCLLPDRDKPYLLDLELARRRIMLLLNKIEEWGWSDLAADDPVMVGLNKARELFTRALISKTPAGSAGFSAEQAASAKESLVTALEAGELLAVRDGQRRLAERLKGSDKPQVGVSVHSDVFAEPLQKVVAGSVDFVSMPMRWSKIEPEEGRFDFSKKDRWIEWAIRSAKLPVAAGPVIDFSPRGCPAWLGVWNHDYETLREFAYEHAKRVITRYRRTVSRWTVCGGLNINNGFSLSVEQMVDLTRVAVLAVRKLHPGAPVFVEITEPFGEHASANSQSVAPLLYAELVLGSGVQTDGFALRVQMGDRQGGRSTRDLLELSSMLDTYAEFDKPMHITAMGCPSGSTNGSGGEEPGHWRTPWSPEAQAAWMDHAMLVALSKPLVKSVCWQALYDTPDGPEMPLGGLVSADGRAKPALKRLAEIRAGLRGGKLPTDR